VYRHREALGRQRWRQQAVPGRGLLSRFRLGSVYVKVPPKLREPVGQGQQRRGEDDRHGGQIDQQGPARALILTQSVRRPL
jgi:hypothetical protein